MQQLAVEQQLGGSDFAVTASRPHKSKQARLDKMSSVWDWLSHADAGAGAGSNAEQQQGPAAAAATGQQQQEQPDPSHPEQQQSQQLSAVREASQHTPSDCAHPHGSSSQQQQQQQPVGQQQQPAQDHQPVHAAA